LPLPNWQALPLLVLRLCHVLSLCPYQVYKHIASHLCHAKKWMGDNMTPIYSTYLKKDCNCPEEPFAGTLVGSYNFPEKRRNGEGSVDGKRNASKRMRPLAPPCGHVRHGMHGQGVIARGSQADDPSAVSTRPILVWCQVTKSVCQNGCYEKVTFYVRSKIPGAASRFRAAGKIYGTDSCLGRLDIKSVILREIENSGGDKCLLCG